MNLREAIQPREFPGHTKGPWEYAYGGTNGTVDPPTKQQFLDYCGECWDKSVASEEASPYLHVVQQEEGDLIIAILGNGPTAHINGPMIAAAPDLLEANKVLRELVPQIFDDLLAKIAIDHATLKRTHPEKAGGLIRARMLVEEYRDWLLPDQEVTDGTR
jgi:hypothetical protein